MHRRRGAVKYTTYIPYFYVLLQLLFASPISRASHSGSSGYEYRISKCDRLKQPANLSVIFHRRRPPRSLFPKRLFIARAIARARDITSRGPREKTTWSNLCASAPLLQLVRDELEREHLVPAGVLTAAPIKRALRASFALYAASHIQIFLFSNDPAFYPEQLFIAKGGLIQISIYQK